MEQKVFTIEVTTTTTNIHRVRAASVESAIETARFTDGRGFRSEKRKSHDVQVREAAA